MNVKCVKRSMRSFEFVVAKDRSEPIPEVNRRRGSHMRQSNRPTPSTAPQKEKRPFIPNTAGFWMAMSKKRTVRSFSNPDRRGINTAYLISTRCKSLSKRMFPGIALLPCNGSFSIYPYLDTLARQPSYCCYFVINPSSELPVIVLPNF